MTSFKVPSDPLLAACVEMAKEIEHRLDQGMPAAALNIEHIDALVKGFLALNKTLCDGGSLPLVWKQAPYQQHRLELMVPAPDIELDTPFGTVVIRAINHDRVTVSTPPRAAITVNRGRLSMSGTWYRQQTSKSWPKWDTETDVLGAVSVQMNKVQLSSYRGSTAPTVKQMVKVREVMSKVVAEWAESPIGQHWLAYAQDAAINNGAVAILNQIGRLEAELDGKRHELTNLLGPGLVEIEEKLR